jgi:hypothetical protein
VILGKWRYGVNLFGISVQAVFRDVGGGATRVEVQGFLSDAFDTFGHAKKQGRLVLSRCIEVVRVEAGPFPGYPSQGARFAGPPAGAPPQSRRAPSVAQSSGQSDQAQARGAMICGLLGLLVFGIILGPIAIILALVALVGMNQSGNDAGRGMAVTGLVMGIIDLIGWAIFIAVAFH